MTERMKFRIQSKTDDIGTYWWIEEKFLFFWWQYEPGYHLSKIGAEKRLNNIEQHLGVEE